MSLLTFNSTNPNLMEPDLSVIDWVPEQTREEIKQYIKDYVDYKLDGSLDRLNNIHIDANGYTVYKTTLGDYAPSEHTVFNEIMPMIEDYKKECMTAIDEAVKGVIHKITVNDCVHINLIHGLRDTVNTLQGTINVLQDTIIQMQNTITWVILGGLALAGFLWYKIKR